jgi:AcrR family transcriptional regulator
MAANGSGPSGNDTAPRPRGTKAGRRQKILDAALQLFSERHYDDIFTDDIARAAGVANGLLFYYFKDKRGLYVAATQRQVDLEMAQWLDPGEGGGPRARIRDLLYRHFDYLKHHHYTYLNMMRRRPGIPDVEEIFERATGPAGSSGTAARPPGPLRRSRCRVRAGPAPARPRAARGNAR